MPLSPFLHNKLPIFQQTPPPPPFIIFSISHPCINNIFLLISRFPNLFFFFFLVFVFPWEDLLVVRRLIQTKGHGQRKKMTVLLLISKLTARAAGAHFLRPPVSSVAVRVAVSGGLIIYALILSVAISLNMKMTLSSNSIASLETGLL